MRLLRALVSWGWAPVIITALAAAGYLYELPMEITLPVMVAIIIIGLIIAGVNAREKKLEVVSLRLKDLSGYFSRRFTGNSSLSIFSIISGLSTNDNPSIWEWARSCGTCQRIFDTWCASFIARAEADFRTRMYSIYLRKYLNELWLINNHYFEFIEQFCEIAERFEIHPETHEQYGRFVLEYNAFAQNLQDNITELRKMHKTEIAPAGVKLARELKKPKAGLSPPPQAGAQK